MNLLEREDVVCPFCGRGVAMGVLVIDPGDSIPASEDGKDVVTHEEPRCPMFETLDGDDFVGEVQRLRERDRGVA